MKHCFIVVDCSGSIITDDSAMVGQINDLIRDLIDSCLNKKEVDIRVICYANGAKVYWESQKEPSYYDIPQERFGGRSNLGKAYEVINTIMLSEAISRSDCCVALISDGQATDNYRKRLHEMDDKNEITKIAISIGTTNGTTDRHASSVENVFDKGISEREQFIERVVDSL